MTHLLPSCANKASASNASYWLDLWLYKLALASIIMQWRSSTSKSLAEYYLIDKGESEIGLTIFFLCFLRGHASGIVSIPNKISSKSSCARTTRILTYHRENLVSRSSSRRSYFRDAMWTKSRNCWYDSVRT